MGQNTPKKSDKGPRCSTTLRCCCYSFFVIVLSFIIILALVLKYRPSLPTIDITDFDLIKFRVGPDSILESKFIISIKLDNSRTQFRIKFKKGSSIVMSYNNTDISTGKLPEFRQQPGDVAEFKVVMEGENKYEGDDLKEASDVPLLLEVKAPIAVTAHEGVTAHVKYRAACALVVDQLGPEEESLMTSHDCSSPYMNVA